jgi:hypothetical protein
LRITFSSLNWNVTSRKVLAIIVVLGAAATALNSPQQTADGTAGK